MSRIVLGLIVCFCVASPSLAEDMPLRIKPEEARKHVGKSVEVVFEVKASKNSVKRKTVFLDSEADFKDEKNLGIAISEKGVLELKEKRSVNDPAEYYRGKTIRVTGQVVLEEERPYIKVDSSDQLDLHEEKMNRE